jgi:hypothetical protein
MGWLSGLASYRAPQSRGPDQARPGLDLTLPGGRRSRRPAREGAVIDGGSDARRARPMPFADLHAALAGRADQAVLYAFDLLSLDGHDLRELPLSGEKTNRPTLSSASHLAPVQSPVAIPAS